MAESENARLSELYAARDEIFLKLRVDATNCFCADTGAPNAKWASVSHGVYLSIDAAGVHRSLGVGTSYVQSITMDAWKPVHLRMMELGGNQRFSEFLREHGVPEKLSIRQKYQTRAARWYRMSLRARAEGRSEPEPLEPGTGHLPVEPPPEFRDERATLNSATSFVAGQDATGLGPFGEDPSCLPCASDSTMAQAVGETIRSLVEHAAQSLDQIIVVEEAVNQNDGDGRELVMEESCCHVFKEVIQTQGDARTEPSASCNVPGACSMFLKGVIETLGNARSEHPASDDVPGASPLATRLLADMPFDVKQLTALVTCDTLELMCKGHP